jgi:hypothetical protein
MEDVLRQAALYSTEVAQETGLLIDLWVRPGGISINAIDQSRSIVMNKVVDWSELAGATGPVLKRAIDTVADRFPKELKRG